MDPSSGSYKLNGANGGSNSNEKMNEKKKQNKKQGCEMKRNRTQSEGSTKDRIQDETTEQNHYKCSSKKKKKRFHKSFGSTCPLIGMNASGSVSRHDSINNNNNHGPSVSLYSTRRKNQENATLERANEINYYSLADETFSVASSSRGTPPFQWTVDGYSLNESGGSCYLTQRHARVARNKTSGRESEVPTLQASEPPEIPESNNVVRSRVTPNYLKYLESSTCIGNILESPMQTFGPSCPASETMSDGLSKGGVKTGAKGSGSGEQIVTVHDDSSSESNIKNQVAIVPVCPTKTVKPQEGTPVDLAHIRRAGPYLLGPRLGNSPVRSIVQCLARLDGTNDFYTLKILTLQNQDEEGQDDRQGKMLLHTEYSLLSLLHNQPGVIHHHGLFKDEALEEKELPSGEFVYTGRVKKRLCLVLDCLNIHDFSSKNADLVNLQHYVIKEKKLTERDTFTIFFNIVRIVESLHEKNIVHRDLKLGNMVLNKRTYEVTITNFCLGKHLVSENDLLKDQRGSPAYISPDVLSGKPYLGKPSDMWALGVVLFTMLYGQFPFYDSVPQELFRKIKSADFTIPNDGRVSECTMTLIRNLLLLDPKERLTATEVLDTLSGAIHTWRNVLSAVIPDQVVPDVDNDDSDGTLMRANLSRILQANNLEGKLKFMLNENTLAFTAVSGRLPLFGPLVLKHLPNVCPAYDLDQFQNLLNS